MVDWPRGCALSTACPSTLFLRKHTLRRIGVYTLVLVKVFVEVSRHPNVYRHVVLAVR